MSRHLPLVIVLAALLACPGAILAGQAPPLNSFVVSTDAAAAQLAIERVGGRVYHIFGQVVLGYVPPTATLEGLGTISAVLHQPVSDQQAAGYGDQAGAAALFWNKAVFGMEPYRSDALSKLLSNPGPIVGDRLIPQGRPVRKTPYLGAAYNADRYSPSEYLVGRVAIGVFFPESAGTAENWTTARQDECLAQMAQATEWWRQREPNANLSFVYEVNRNVPVSIEPISTQGTSGGLDVWINECLAAKGFTDSDYIERAYSYVNALRQSKGTDWAVATFIADSEKDADGCFGEGSFAFTLWGGPIVVMTYDNDGYGIGNMNAVFAHEFAHAFWANDEYYESGATVDERSGYFNEKNGNVEESGVTNVACIMRGQIEPYSSNSVCMYTRHQLGFQDYNRNNVEDELDVPPTVALPAFSPDPTEVPVITYQGTARVGLLPNLNTARPELPHPDISLNTIAAVEYRLDGGEWTAAKAADGSLNSGAESFSFTLGLTKGQHTVEVRARDNRGQVSVVATDSVESLSDALAVTAVTPANGDLNAPYQGPVTATFTKAMDVASLTTSTFRLSGAAQGPLGGTIHYDAATRTATFDTGGMLAADQYTARVVGGLSGVKDSDGGIMVNDRTWTFTVPVDDDPPDLTLVTPVAGSKVSGLVDLLATAQDASGVARVEFFVDGVNVGVLAAPPYAASWDSRPLWVDDGLHTVMVRAYDAAGRQAQVTADIYVENSHFEDVPKSSPFWAYVEAVAREGISSGCSQTPSLFCPASPVTRGQMAVFLCRAAGLAPLRPATPSFVDVPATDVRYGYVEAIKAAGITAGCDPVARLYCPNAPISRGQMAVFLCRAAHFAPYSKALPTFADVPATSQQYSYIEALYLRAITRGCASAPLRYCPAASVTRGEMAVFICRAFNLQVN